MKRLFLIMSLLCACDEGGFDLADDSAPEEAAIQVLDLDCTTRAECGEPWTMHDVQADTWSAELIPASHDACFSEGHLCIPRLKGLRRSSQDAACWEAAGGTRRERGGLEAAGIVPGRRDRVGFGDAPPEFESPLRTRHHSSRDSVGVKPPRLEIVSLAAPFWRPGSVSE